MSKKSKILLGIIVLAICFGASVFGTYEYNNYKVFNNLANQGKKYMLQKDYDKAIQTFQQALSYKKDADIQNSLALAQNLKNENSKKDIISKNIQLATDAAKNSKYDDANKYLDEVLKVDPDNSEVKSLKDSYTKIIQQQKDDATKVTNASAKENASTSGNVVTLTYDQALELVKSKVKIKEKEEGLFKLSDFKNALQPADNCPYYVIIRDALTPSGDEDFTEAEYHVYKHTGKIIECAQGQYKDIN